MSEESPGLVSPDYIAFRCKPDVLLADYLDFYRGTALWRVQLRSSGKGSIRTRYYYSDVADFMIPLPSIDEQRQILLW